jgi:hypothetical protein
MCLSLEDKDQTTMAEMRVASWIILMIFFPRAQLLGWSECQVISMSMNAGLQGHIQLSNSSCDSPSVGAVESVQSGKGTNIWHWNLIALLA